MDDLKENKKKREFEEEQYITSLDHHYDDDFLTDNNCFDDVEDDDYITKSNKKEYELKKIDGKIHKTLIKNNIMYEAKEIYDGDAFVCHFNLIRKNSPTS